MTLSPVLDLGPLDGPVLCFGGPYSNAQATEAVLTQAARRNIPPERIICTGDVVAYCADPETTVKRIRDAAIPVVMGNCEEELGFSGSDCNCGFEEGSDCANWSKDWFTFAAMRLDDDARNWMRALPRQIRFTLSGRRFAVIHGGVDNISEYVFASTPDGTKAGMIERLDVDAVIGGHSGLPFTELSGPRVLNTQNIGPRLWHNPGAVGIPANDGTPRGWFSVITPEVASVHGGIDITLHELNYDHETAAAALGKALPGLPYADTLTGGLWPNMSVLPEAERGLRGRALGTKTVHWPGVNLQAAE